MFTILLINKKGEVVKAFGKFNNRNFFASEEFSEERIEMGDFFKLNVKGDILRFGLEELVLS